MNEPAWLTLRETAAATPVRSVRAPLAEGWIASWEALPVVSAPWVPYLISLMMLNIGR
jgi:hypothetical protein